VRVFGGETPPFFYFTAFPLDAVFFFDAVFFLEAAAVLAFFSDIFVLLCFEFIRINHIDSYRQE